MTYPSFIRAAVTALFLMAVTTTFGKHILVNDAPVSIDQFGAQAGNPSFDNGPIIIKALQSAKSILLPANKNYYISSRIFITGLSGLTITATGSTITNTNYDAQIFHFAQCSNITIIGGHYTRDVMPDKQDGKNQHCIEFVLCTNVSISNAHIERSPEMGICNNGVNGGVYTNNTIEHCMRDGIYAHYSINLKYIDNTINDIKDDGLSMHDYGIPAQKAFIIQAGHPQAGYSVISGNHVSNCVEGIASIGCTHVTISDNTVKNTVDAGISLFNSEDLSPGSDARVYFVAVLNNTIENAGADLTVDGVFFKSTAKYIVGRSAIYIACVKQGQPYYLSKLRSGDINVQGNRVTNCPVNGATLYNIDGLILKDNQFTNCHSDNNADTGDIVEIQNCTAINVSDNEVIDTRRPALHDRGYAIVNCSGTFKPGVVNGFKVEAVSIKNSPGLTR